MHFLIIVFVSLDGTQRGNPAKQGVLLPSLGARQREELALPCSQRLRMTLTEGL